MDTRSKKGSKNEFTDAELEQIRLRLDDREARLKEQSEALQRDSVKLQRERGEFEREQEIARREIEKTRNELLDKETELSKETEPDQDLDRTSNLEITREISDLRQEINLLKAGASSFQPRATAPGAYPPYTPEFSHDTSPHASFREALESVPYFDGYNIPVTHFIRACRRVRETATPSSERNLTRQLIHKLRGRAYIAVEDEPCDTITQLIDLLNEAFGSRKTVDQCRGELSTACLRQGEHILDYIGRVKDLRLSILDAERCTNGILTNTAIFNIDAFTARSFCDGLPLEYRIQLSPEHYTRPFEAFSHAKILAKRCETDKERFNRPAERTGSYTVRNPIAHSTPLRSRDNRRVDPNRESNSRQPEPVSRFSNSRSGNLTESARPNENSLREPRPQIPAKDPSEKWCRYCKNPGHEIRECRKRAYNNNQRDQGNAPHPSRTPDEPRVGTSRETPRPIRAITEQESENTNSQS